MQISQDIEAAVHLLRAGQLVAFPTETVYGLGADATQPRALARLYAVKGRPRNHPVIVHVSDASQMAHWALDIPPWASALAEAFWPGPLTLLVPRAPHVLDAVTGGQGLVGLRVPAHPTALALLEAMKTASASGSPVGIAAPSANRFGRVSPTRASHVAADLGNDIAMILDGGHCAVGLESTIVGANDAGRPEILRPGMLTPARLMDVLQPWTSLEALAWLPVSPAPAGKHSAPGTLASHYAPQKPLMLVPPDDWPVALARLGAAGKRAGVWASQPMTSQPVVAVWLARPSEATLAAQGLYEAMRVLDAHPDVEVILMESVSAEALAQTGTGWTAIADRLARASAAGQASEAQASHPLSETPNPAG